MTSLRQPEDSSLCGQTCVAMIADVSLAAAIAAVGHRRGTHTKDVIRALRSLDVCCADRLRRISRARPVIPQKAIVAIVQYVPRADGKRDQRLAHWMVSWNGVIHDPGGRWPNYDGWTMTSYLEIM